jgi:hypothetical protein
MSGLNIRIGLDELLAQVLEGGNAFFGRTTHPKKT